MSMGFKDGGDSKTLINIFKELENIDVEIQKYDAEICKHITLLEDPNESKEPLVIESLKLKELSLKKHNILMNKAKNLADNADKAVALKCDYFIKNFSNTQDRLDYINRKLEGEIILHGTRELFTSLAYNPSVSSYSPLNIYYAAYKFPKIFDQEVTIVYEQVLDIKDSVDYKEVSHDLARSIIENKRPIGKFVEIDGDKYIGIDNTTGEAWVEEFDTKEKCLDWLNGKESEGEWAMEI